MEGGATARVTVTPVKVAELEIDKAVETYNTDFGAKIWAPVFIYLIHGLQIDPIVIDAGLCSPDSRGMVAGARVQGGRNAMISALERMNLNPPDIKMLILSHLHIDHLSNVDLFDDAQIVVQESELDYASHPLETQAHVYVTKDLDSLRKRDLRIINGDERIIGGLEVIHVPGHTPGIQAVCVGTSKGNVVVCGDAVPMYHNWYPSNPKYGTPSHLSRIPPGIHVSVRDCFESMEKISTRADIIVPSHDPLVKDMVPIPKG